MTDTKHDLQKQVLMIAKSIEYGFDSVGDESSGVSAMEKENIEHNLQTIDQMKAEREKLKLDLITCMAQLSQPARTLLTEEIDSIQKKIDDLTDTVGA